MKKIAIIFLFLTSLLTAGEYCPICRKEDSDLTRVWFNTLDGKWAHRDCYEIIIPCFRTLIDFNEKIIRTKKNKLNLELNNCFIYNVEAVERCTNGLSLREYYQMYGERELRVLVNTIGIEVSKKYAKHVVETILPDEEF